MPHPVIVMLVLTIALFLVGQLLAPSPNIENARPAALGDFQFPTASETRVVPIVWGTIDIKGPNVVWYGDLKTVKITKKIKVSLFKKKKITTGHRYFVGVDVVLCYGPVDRVTRVEVGDKVASPGVIGPFTDAGINWVINKPKHFGGKNEGGGFIGTFKVYGGTANQDTSTYLIAKTPAAGDATLHPSYVDICHAVWQRGEIGERPNMEDWVFRVTRFPVGLVPFGANVADTIIRGDVENGDANPVEVLYEIMTNDVWGLDLDPSVINAPSFVAAHATLAAEGNGFSLIVNSFKKGEDLIMEILKQIDASLGQGSDGMYTLKLVREDFVFADLPIFNESNITEVTQFSRGGWSSTRNHVNIKYTDRNQNFIETGAMAQDTANFRTQGRHIRDDQSYSGVKHNITARDIAARELRAAAFPLAKAQIKMTREAFSLYPGDVFRLQWADLGILDMVMRVGPIDMGEIGDGVIRVDCMQDIFKVGETVFEEPSNSGWIPINTDAVAAVSEIIREIPLILRNMDLETFLDPQTGAYLMSLVAAPNNVHVSFNQYVDDLGFGEFGQEGEGGMTPTGLLSAAYGSAATTDIDATGFTLLGMRSSDVLSDDTPSNIQSGLNLGLIEGAAADGSDDEIFGWETFVDNLDGSGSFTNIHRGLLDTQAKTHAISSRVYFFSDGPPALALPKAATASLDFKHPTRTTYDELPLASAAIVSYTAADRISHPHHPANVKLAGDSTLAWVSDVAPVRLPFASDIGPTDALLTWGHRANDEILVRDADVENGSQDTDVEYELKFYNQASPSTVRRTVVRDSADVLGWKTYTYTRANIELDFFIASGDVQVRVDIIARKKSDGAVSRETLSKVFTVDLTDPPEPPP